MPDRSSPSPAASGPAAGPGPGPQPEAALADQPVSSIRNLGPAAEAAFRRAGITSAAALYEIGAEEGYRLLLAAGERPHFISFYVLVMALQGRPWNDCKGDEKTALRARFDAICAGMRGMAEKPDRARDVMLRQFGVMAKGSAPGPGSE